jgi:hypothetical protein
MHTASLVLALALVGWIGNANAQSFVGSWTMPVYGGTLYLCMDNTNTHVYGLATEILAIRGQVTDGFNLVGEVLAAGEYNRQTLTSNWGIVFIELSTDGSNLTWTTYSDDSPLGGTYVSTRISTDVPLPAQCWTSNAKAKAFVGQWQSRTATAIWSVSFCAHPYYFSRYIASICPPSGVCAYHYGICFQNVCTGSWKDQNDKEGVSLFAPTEDDLLKMSLWTLPLPWGKFPANLNNATAHTLLTLVRTGDDPSDAECYTYGYLVEAELVAGVGKVCVGLAVLVVSAFTLFQ